MFRNIKPEMGTGQGWWFNRGDLLVYREQIGEGDPAN